MANVKDYFALERGIDIDEVLKILPFTTGGTPGASGDTNTAEKGSMALDTSTGDIWIKFNTTGTTADWKKLIDLDTVTDLVAGISWLEPARGRDDSNITLAAFVAKLNDTGTPDNIGGVDSDLILDGDRFLLSNLSGVDSQVYVVNGTPGSGALLYEDPNDPSNGDMIFIYDGDDDGRTYVYNDGDWFLSNQASADELGFIRAFIGKDIAGGTGLGIPNYASILQITQGVSLEAAIGQLDTAFGADLALGTYVTAGQAAFPAIQALDAAIAGAVTNYEVTGIGATPTLIASAKVDVAAALKWLVRVNDGANVRAAEIFCTHDGIDGGADAGNVDYNVFSKLKIGTLPGITYTIDHFDTGVDQIIRLRAAKSAGTMDARVRQEIVAFSGIAP